MPTSPCWYGAASCRPSSPSREPAITDSRKTGAPLVLITRTYCHLCHEMEAAVGPIAAAFGLALELIDVDSDDRLEALYGERVPVLRHGERELCHYFVDTHALRAYLEESGLQATAERQTDD